MARPGDNIYLRKDGRYEGRYIKGRHPDGKPIFGFVYAKQYGEVERRLAEAKARLRDGRDAIGTGQRQPAHPPEIVCPHCGERIPLDKPT